MELRLGEPRRGRAFSFSAPGRSSLKKLIPCRNNRVYGDSGSRMTDL